MKRRLLLVLLLLITLMSTAQTAAKSKIVMKNGDVVTGKIIEMKVGEFVKIEIVGNNVVTIPYSDISTVYLDENEVVRHEHLPGLPKPDAPLKKIYFETHNEIVLGLGVGKVYNLPDNGLDEPMPTVLNDDVFGGLYTANGIGFRRQFFVGIGIGFNAHSNKPSYSIPVMLDLRCRVLRDKKLSPLVMFATGAEYLDAGLGTYTFCDGLGLSIKFKETFNAHLLLTHTMVRFMPNLSVEHGPEQEAYGNSYYNYLGLRLGVSFKI